MTTPRPWWLLYNYSDSSAPLVFHHHYYLLWYLIWWHSTLPFTIISTLLHYYSDGSAPWPLCSLHLTLTVWHGFTIIINPIAWPLLSLQHNYPDVSAYWPLLSSQLTLTAWHSFIFVINPVAWSLPYNYNIITLIAKHGLAFTIINIKVSIYLLCD